MFLITIMLVVVVQIIGYYFEKRYDMSEKVDRGIEFCYWKLSNRRKFIRTLWLIPVSAVITIGIYKESQSYVFTGMIGAMFFITICLQAIDNYKKWKNDLRHFQDK